MRPPKIQFDADQPHQLEAINAVVDLFAGQPLAATDFEIGTPTHEVHGTLATEAGFGNQLVLSDEQLLANLQQVQKRSQLAVDQSLTSLDFSVEMETGTGKTYVYLRTIYELHQRYGFTKFVIVVPTVAIREGVLANIRLLREHFRDLYGQVPEDAWVYDSRRLSRLRQFGTATHLQVLVMNIDAFNKNTNVIMRDDDRMSGRRPIEFIQGTRPIAILDEPQNMESDRARAAIASLNPVATLRYSATHRNLYHPLYRLDPVRAYDLGLVKRIEVASVLDEPDFAQPYIHVEKITHAKSKISAALAIDVDTAGKVKRKIVTVRNEQDHLYELSGGRLQYKDYGVDVIDANTQSITFTNGLTLDVGQQIGGNTDAIMRFQIHETVREHLDRERALARRTDMADDHRTKVLSLFFIDRVANYVPTNGKIRIWFEEAYTTLAARPVYADLNLPPVEQVHAGYFATGSKGGARDTRGTSAADEDAYELIMRDKERLLSTEEPVRFVFSHSALREGWDNPNVFTICTLNETKSELKKRQEIGRGLRLPVMANGQRCFDTSISRLTIVANESYDEFARKLQTEMEQECGVDFSGRVRRRRGRRTVRVKNGWNLDPDFMAIWERIKHRTRYRVGYSTDEIVARAASRLAAMPALTPPRVTIARAELRIVTSGHGDTDDQIEQTGIIAQRTRTTAPKPLTDQHAIPDLLGHLQRHVNLTRSTIARVLRASGRLSEVTRNPQAFLEQAQDALNGALNTLLAEGITYERVAGSEYEMRLFEDRELETYVDALVTNVNNSIYTEIEIESDVERAFAEEMKIRDDVRLFFKLPRWFQVDTPVGPYGPDWAIVVQDEEGMNRCYLVAETKGTTNLEQLRAVERLKVLFGEKHFQTIGVPYQIASTAADIVCD